MSDKIAKAVDQVSQKFDQFQLDDGETLIHLLQEVIRTVETVSKSIRIRGVDKRKVALDVIRSIIAKQIQLSKEDRQLYQEMTEWLLPYVIDLIMLGVNGELFDFANKHCFSFISCLKKGSE